ncbi:hypothetical protein BACSP_04056 [Bacillus sp. T2.9-1]|uniref:ribosomal maturation YjgA family protein n=1 Tax=Bacillus sp. T2.9-1 TaxID=3041163 RepID=UPI0024777606|nr:DUF2809 domain-containing protein [Bacillus sp. T2.9-1]CAI9395373.1 hypothetical protein BACSP_04056 [Bacillus sp. T2.9-1]
MKQSNEKLKSMERKNYLVAAFFMVALGLFSRRFSNLLPDFISQHAGDMLWSMMIYFGFRFLLGRKKILLAMVGSILFCFGIEFSQLYQADWINELRNSTMGALILGRGFLVVDLVRYLSGIAIACLVDKLLICRKR